MARTKQTATAIVNTPSNVDLGELGFNMVESGPTLGFYHVDDGEIPEAATYSSAGLDLRAYVKEGSKYNVYNQLNQKSERTVRPALDGTKASILLEPGDRALIPTGLYADIPAGHWIAIHPRSGSSWKEGKGLTNSVAVIDEDYVNEIFISVINLSNVRIKIEDGERIAQAVLHKRPRVKVARLENKPSIKTDRTGGFGHTGVN